jgi:predicted ATPase
LWSPELRRRARALDQAIGLYDPIEHRALVTRFGQDLKVAILCYRSQALWSLGYPEAALADADEAVKNARESNHAATLMYALAATSYVYTCAGKYELVNADADELSALANQKNALFWKPGGALFRGAVSSLTNKAATAVEMLISGMTAYRSVGSTAYLPWFLALLAKAYSELGQFDDAWRCTYETIAMMEKTDERWCEAEVHRLAGEIALNRRRRTRRRQRRTLSARSQSPANNKLNPGNSAPQ